MKVKLLLFTAILFLAGCTNNKPIVFTDYVNPFIGTGGHGHTYPGAAVPFGMVQLSPDTRLTGWDGCSAYHYSDDVIYGFSHTHLSGTGCTDFGDILLMPTTGKPTPDNGSVSGIEKGYASHFSHNQEKAMPGYYRVELTDYHIDVELTTTERVGFHRYIYPKDSQANIIIDLEHRDKVIMASLEKTGEAELSGSRRSDAWARDQHIYFVMQFSQAIDDFGIWDDDKLTEKTALTGEHVKGFVQFKNPKNRAILVKVGISAVSIEGARKNLETEIPDWNFDGVRAEANNKWNQQLGKVEVTGGSKNEKINFYSALYHSFLNPNIFMDVDGKFRGTDLQIHEAKNYEYHSVFSLWDTYRATHPLFTILETKKTNDFINTFLDMYRYGGKLPVWELAGNYTGCMIGYHSIPVITDAWMKGIRNYDGELAMQAMEHSANLNHLGIPQYKQYGFIPSGEEHESVSKTLEYAYDDYCIATMAKEMGYDDIYSEYIQRAQSYKNIFDPSTGFMRAKTNNKWFEPFDPREVNFNYTEANCWQYSFYVPQDINSLIALQGGDEGFCNKLDELFSTNSETTGREQADITGLIGQYAHGNEPSHHMAYLYCYAGKPWKTQEIIRKIMNELYSNAPDGLCGNEDCGQMSSWYVFSALGFYPVTPGSSEYVFGTPLFTETKINLENGNTFIIKAKKTSSTNKYIQSIVLNNAPYTKTYISHQDIMDGGTLEFVMGDKPSDFGTEISARPVLHITEHQIQPVPFIRTGNKAFFDTTSLTLGCINAEAKIYFTLDGSTPTLESAVYTNGIILSKTTKVKAFAYSPDQGNSNVIEATLMKIPTNRTIKIYSKYANQYSAGGDYALIDFLRGKNSYKTGLWQGYQGQDLRAEVDLGTIMDIHMLETGFLQDENSWIFMPTSVEYYTSKDGNDFTKVATVKTKTDPKSRGEIVEQFTVQLNTQARYVKVVANSAKVCPPWHKAAGEKSWIFVDEIVVK